MTAAQRNILVEFQKIAVVGGREEALPFLAIGAAVFITQDTDAARDAVLHFAEKRHPIILVSDDLIRDMGDILERFSSSPIPSITSIPGKPGRTSFYDERIKNMIKQAIGLDFSVQGKQ
jgi:vacuolar-type H+-ATPase subunit F/Vma7